MKNKLFHRVNKRLSLGSAAALLVGVSMIGQLLGFLRTKLVNANFPTTGPDSTDAYFAAFKIPDFFFFTLAAGALGVAFIPFLSDRLNNRDRKGAWELSSSLMNFMAVLMLLVGVIIFAFADQLINIVQPGVEQENPELFHNATTIMRFLALNPFLFTVSGILASLQQTLGKFFFFAIAPLFYNSSIIISAMVFSLADGRTGGPWNMGLKGLGLGALIGAVAQLLIVAVGMRATGYRYRPKINWRRKDFRQALRQLPARSIDQGIDSINSIAETRFAHKIGPGNISYYENAFTLHMVPIQLLGNAIATAAFPRLTERLTSGRPDLFRRDFLHILRTMIWLAVPTIVVSYFARGYLARMIFAQRDAGQIAIIFGFLVVAILFRVMYAIMSRWFYAQKDTKTPLLISLFTIALNIYLAYTLSRPWSYGVEGLAMAQSIVAAVEVAILGAVMVWRDPKLFDKQFGLGLLKILSVTGFSIVAGYVMVSFLPLGIDDRGVTVLGSKLAAIAGVTFTVHVMLSYAYGLEEAQPIIKKLKRLASVSVKI
ncbi:murein biosynthesis integral membrane protein MurJ [Candidatus Saccharibacteria bacterium]|nr:MAG: murein biosynthesis integral membrane protein MurJ [Candidatus Saccharibacteria bacterium]